MHFPVIGWFTSHFPRLPHSRPSSADARDKAGGDNGASGRPLRSGSQQDHPRSHFTARTGSVYQVDCMQSDDRFNAVSQAGCPRVNIGCRITDRCQDTASLNRPALVFRKGIHASLLHIGGEKLWKDAYSRIQTFRTLSSALQQEKALYGLETLELLLKCSERLYGCAWFTEKLEAGERHWLKRFSVFGLDEVNPQEWGFLVHGLVFQCKFRDASKKFSEADLKRLASLQDKYEPYRLIIISEQWRWVTRYCARFLWIYPSESSMQSALKT